MIKMKKTVIFWLGLIILVSALLILFWNILDGGHYLRSVQVAGSGAVYSVAGGLHRLLDHRYLYDVI